MHHRSFDPELVKAALAASPAPTAWREMERDKARLDKLSLLVVNVRKPLVHGSRDLFWATPVDVEGGDDEPSDLRAKIG